MKLNLRSLSLLVLVLIVQNSIASKLSKATEALEIYDYFKAKKLFYKAYKKNEAAASYGLSIIYGRNDNPFYHLDSARKYILNADSLFLTLEPKKKEDYASLGLTLEKVKSWKDTVATKAYDKAIKKKQVREINQFLEDYDYSRWIQEARILRDSIVYDSVLTKNQSTYFKSFLNRYPRSHLRIEARNRYNELLFKEVNDKSEYGAEFKRFLATYPNNPYAGQAQDSIYSRYIKKASITKYHQFIQENPNNRNVAKAWRALYKMYTASNSPSSIIDFRVEYPDYPFKEELSQDYMRNSQLFFPYKNGQLWGYKNIKGEVMIKAQFEFVSEFKEGAALVLKDDQIGYINKRGEVIVPLIYSDGEDFNSGVATVYQDDFAGLVDKLNQMIMPCSYDYIAEASEETILVAKDGKYGYYNLEGEQLIGFNYQKASSFEQGMAIVQSDSLFGAINVRGDTLIPFKYAFLEPFNEFGMARAKVGDYFGVIDKNGTKVMDFKFDAISDLKQDYAVLVEGNKYGFMSSKGNQLTPIKYDYDPSVLYSDRFVNGYSKVRQKGKVGMIDTLDSKVMPAIFEDIKSYSLENLIAVKKRGKWGYCDQRLKLILPYEYDDAYTFINGEGLIRKDFKWYRINNEAVLEEANFDDLEKKSRFFVLTKDQKIGLMGLNYQPMTSIKYVTFKMFKEEWVQLIAEDSVEYIHLDSGEHIIYN